MKKIKCFFGMHDWTCAAEEGIKATPEQIANGVDGFFDYAKMFCKNCGTVAEISKQHLKQPKQ